MRVDVLIPDAPAPNGAIPHVFTPAPIPDAPVPGAAGRGGADAFSRLVDAAGAILSRADAVETAFAAHRGGLQEMVVERARADIALQVAATAAQRAAQSLSTLLGMQI